MFDRVIAAPSSQRWRTFLIIGTAGGHAAVLTALVLVAFWKIDKLPVNGDREITLAVKSELPPPGGPPPGAKLERKKDTVAKKPRPAVPVQPTIATDPTPIATDSGPAGDGAPGGDGTNPDGDPDSTEVGDGSCATPPCGDKADPAPVVVVKKAPPQTVVLPPNVAAGLRVAGNEKIYPPDSVRVAMVHAGQDKLQGTIKLCVSAGGAIESVKVLKSTGHDSYDAELVREMRGWRYRPYAVNGVATPMCTVAVVIYRMTR